MLVVDMLANSLQKALLHVIVRNRIVSQLVFEDIDEQAHDVAAVLLPYGLVVDQTCESFYVLGELEDAQVLFDVLE